MKVYIDLGAFKGKSLEKAMFIYNDFDLYVAFEPLRKMYLKLKDRYKNNDKIKVVRSAASDRDRKNIEFYPSLIPSTHIRYGQGSSLHINKKSGTLDQSNPQFIETIDFAKYIIDNFNKDDYIVLKIDIEGEEYNLLERMIETGAIFYIDKIYCEWHYKLFKKDENINKERHIFIVSKLKSLGFDLKGNKIDEFRARFKRDINRKSNSKGIA